MCISLGRVTVSMLDRNINVRLGNGKNEEIRTNKIAKQDFVLFV